MMDTESKELYMNMFKKFFELSDAINSFVNYEDGIADGLTGLFYILMTENIPFTFDGNKIIFESIDVVVEQTIDGKLLTTVNSKKMERDYPFMVYEKYIKERLKSRRS